MKGLIERELTGGQVLKMWLERQFQPLAARVDPMYLYEGPEDPTRMASGELRGDDM